MRGFAFNSNVFTLNLRPFKDTFNLFMPHFLNNSSSRKRCIAAFALILVDIACASLIPYCSKAIVEHQTVSTSQIILMLTALLGIFWTLEKIMTHIQEIIFFPVINNTIRDLSYKLVQHLHQVPLTTYQNLSISEILSAFKRVGTSARTFIKIFCLLIVPTFLKVVFAIIMTVQIGLFGLFLVPCLILSLYTLYKGIQTYVKIREKAWSQTDEVLMKINDSISNTKIVRPFQDLEMQSLAFTLEKEASLWYDTNTKHHMMHIIIGLILGGSFTLILLSTIQGLYNQTLSIGDFIFIKGQLIAAFLPFKTFTLECRQLAESMIDIKKIVSFFKLPIFNFPNCESKNKREFIVDVKNDHNPVIEFKNISFGYNSNQPIFNELNFSIQMNKKIVITGDNGCGKSSLLGLLAGLYKPNSGSISIKGQSINNYSLEEQRKLIHYIPQDFRLFNISLRDNIIYGSSFIQNNKYNSKLKNKHNNNELNNDYNKNNDDLENIIHKMGLTDLISRMPKGLDSKVGEMGVCLSGGEKQRVALARALLLKPEILILDETLQSLNEDHEKEILDILSQTIPTLILVSHRESTLNYVDKVFKLEEGVLKSIENGEIMKKKSYIQPWNSIDNIVNITQVAQVTEKETVS